MAQPEKKSKYASFTPEKKEDDTKVDTVTITFVHPTTRKVTKKDVWYDPETWNPRSGKRFLVSSELINLLTESRATRHARFKAASQKLVQTRSAFLVDLFRLRGLSEQLVRASGEQEDEQNKQPQLASFEPEEDEDPCAVQFFAPELYFDDFTYESLEKANKIFETYLAAETGRMTQRLDLLGGGSWKNLLFYALKYIPVTEVGETIMDAVPDSSTRRTVENAITHGVWDQMSDLIPAVEKHETELQVCEEREEVVSMKIGQLLEEIQRWSEKEKDAERRTHIPIPEMPPELQVVEEKRIITEDSEEELEAMSSEDDGTSTVVSLDFDTDEEMAAIIKEAESKGIVLSEKKIKAKLKILKKQRKREKKIAKIMEEKTRRDGEVAKKKAAHITKVLAYWEEKSANAAEEVRVLAEPLKKMEVETIEQLDEEFREAEQQAKQLEQQAEAAAKEVEEQMERAEKLTEEVEAQENEALEERAQVEELQVQVKSLPPPDPRVLLLKTLQAEHKDLILKAKQAKATIVKVKGRLRSLITEIKEVYRRLSWDLDESGDDGVDDDDGQGEKPYWLRRKLAKQSATSRTPFNENLFLNSEDHFHRRRVKKMAQQEKARRKEQILTQLSATHRAQGRVGSETVCESNLLPFHASEGRHESAAADSVERAIEVARRRLKPPKEEALPVVTEAPRVARVKQLRESLEGQLLSCADCFGKMLPSEGGLAEFKPRLQRFIAQIRGPADDGSEEDLEEVERHLEDSTAELHGLIGEVVGLSDQDQTTGAVRHSLDFGELRKRLSEVRMGQAQLQKEVRAAKSRTAGQLLQGEDAFPMSNSPSPRLHSPYSQARFQSLDYLGESLEVVSGDQQRTNPKQKGARGDTSQGARSDVVDFGFRPDGTGEDSLENWSLFKVNKAPERAERSGTVNGASSTGSCFRVSHSSSMNRTSSDRMRETNPKVARLQRVAADCDFHEYMSQMQSTQDMWRSASAPEFKKGPSLPELVKKSPAKSNTLQPALQGASGRWKASSPGRRMKMKMQATAPPDTGWLSSSR
eukprot:TRINITY_DN88545_c0_g1_i1.p1 TRINITY_DN88545_c0_g1~~TRINITY_DN88545_c0_g1_i1.p1  ORF type:complete len:1040 (-),score=264.51 TRINITY_DN88545_c0_g1_i1:233-3352(-)